MMKKDVKILTAICIVVLAITSIYAVNSKTAKQNPQHQALSVAPQTCTDYEWYRDEYLTDPVGTISDINVECNRLSTLFSGYVFTSSQSMGLYPFEWGYHKNLPVVVIYSDLQ